MKIAISIPDPIFSAAEALAAALNKPRSQLYAEAMAQFVSKHSGASITQRLNEVYGREQPALEAVFSRAQSKAIDVETW
jgi:hypothetical protein